MEIRTGHYCPKPVSHNHGQIESPARSCPPKIGDLSRFKLPEFSFHGRLVFYLLTEIIHRRSMKMRWLTYPFPWERD